MVGLNPQLGGTNGPPRTAGKDGGRISCQCMLLHNNWQSLVVYCGPCSSFLFTPHRIAQMRCIGADVSMVGLSVCLSVGHVTDRYPAKTAGPIEMPFGMCGGMGNSNHVLDGSPHPPMVRGNFGGISSPLKSIGIACSRVFIERRMIRVDLW